MPTVDYLELARTLSQSVFASQLAGCFLLKRPQPGVAIEPARGGFGFATVQGNMEVNPFAKEWQVLPIRKRPGNPFPARISVGRATNCDIVLRVPSVSKVHAHILREGDATFFIQDNRPSNPTFHNKVELIPGATRPLEVGDTVGFGHLEFEFVDAAKLYEVLQLALAGRTLD